MCLHLACGLHVLLTFAHAPWHLDMNFHRPGHPVSTTCQACWQISEFLSNTSTNREKVGMAAKSKDGLFVDGLVSLSTWHFGSPRLWEILGFLSVFDFAPKQTLQFTAKKKVLHRTEPPQTTAMLNEAMILSGGDSPPKIDLVQLREASYAKKYSRLCLLSQNLIIKAKVATFLLV